MRRRIEASMSAVCPACGSSRTREYFRREDVPVHQHRLHPTAVEARVAPRDRLDFACCDECAFVWNRAFRSERLAYVPGYDNDASGSPRFRRHLEDRVEAMVAGGVSERSVLEIGSGNGEFLRRLCRRGGNHGIGLDPAFSAVPHDAADAVELRGDAFRAGDPLPAADVVVCRHLIEHLAEPLSLLRAIHEALVRPRTGLLYLETPSLEWVVEHDAFWDFFYEHCGYFTQAALQHLFDRAGLQPVEIRRVFDGQYWWAVARPREGAPMRELPPADRPASVDGFPARQARALADWQRRVENLSVDRPVVVWGAGAKGTTFVQLVDPRAEHVEALVDVHPGKQSRYVPASGHRVQPPAWLQHGPARTALVMNPAYEDEIRSWLREHAASVSLQTTGAA